MSVFFKWRNIVVGFPFAIYVFILSAALSWARKASRPWITKLEQYQFFKPTQLIKPTENCFYYSN
jgi:hypothetical protein